MRRPRQTVSAVADFACSAGTVWRVLTRAQGYKDWFGFPRTETLGFIDPGFTTGAKLSFKGQTTFVITDLRQEHKLSFSNNDCQISFDIEPFDEGVSVSLTMDIYSAGGPYEGEDIKLFCSETLRALKKVTGIAERLAYTEPKNTESVKRNNLAEFLVRVFAGYRRPVISSESSSVGEVYSTIIENTEASVTIGRRALLVSCILVLFFFISIRVSLSFQRSDIVPSSGLSLLESESVNKYLSTLIRVGEEKQDIERKLSCQGEKIVNPDSSIEFHYASLMKDTYSEPVEHIYVIYDAYGKARKFAYIDLIQSGKALYRVPPNRKLREDLQYYDLYNANILLSPSMNLYEVEEIIGVPVSAYIVDKNGDSIITTLFFGKFKTDDIFKTNYKSQIVVVLNEVTGTTSVSYYNPIDEYDSLPTDEMTRMLRRQYAGLEEFLFDRYVYEKAFLLHDISKEQVELILETKGFLLSPGLTPADKTSDPELETQSVEQNDPKQVETPEDEQSGPVIERYIYTISNPADPRGAMPRNVFWVEYTDGSITSVLYKNLRLSGYAVNTTGHLNSDSFSRGMTLTVATRIAGILPSFAILDKDTTTLYYGQEILSEYTGVSDYSIKLTFVQNGRLLSKTEFFEGNKTEEIEERSDTDANKL